jgi:diguanylate cyclase (GGDEF)-like protein
LTQEQVLLAILGALLIANVILVASIPFRIRRGRPAPDPVVATDHEGVEDARAVAAIEAFVEDESPERDGVAPGASEASPDALAGLADPAAWSRAISEESDRVARFGRPATVVMAELPHLDRLVGAFGRGVADRVVTETARVLASEGRLSDRITQLGEARFAILLAETEEVAAEAYVQRVQGATDSWLASVGLLTRLSFGWASPGEGQSVATAAITAEERMHDASRRARLGPEPRSGPRSKGN